MSPLNKKTTEKHEVTDFVVGADVIHSQFADVAPQ
jgi:hypothetical protein